jgi:DHA1 family tetracycline resistance protein-like MFS transporter
MRRKYVLPILFFTLLLDMIGTGMVFPIIPILFTDPASHSFMLAGYSQGMQYLIAGLVTSLFGIMQFLAAPVLGELSDVYGRKKLLTIGVGVLAISQVIFGFGIMIASVGLVLFARAIAGLAAANFSIAQATIADVTEPQDRAKNFGLMGAAFGVGFILGPVLGGWIAGVTQNAAAPFWFAGVLGIINLVFISIMLPETRKVTQDVIHRFSFLKGIRNLHAAFLDLDARNVYMTILLYMSGFAFMTSFTGVLLVQRFNVSEAAVGTYFGAIGAWMVFTQIVLLRLIAPRFNERAILRVTFLAIAAVLAAYPFLPSILAFYIIMPFIAIPVGFTMANLQSLVSKSVSADKQGAAMGISGSLQAFAQGVVPLVAGIGSGVIGIGAPFIAGSVLVLSAWVVLFNARKAS